MPTQQELNISSGSLSLIKQRDSGSGVIFVNPTDSNVDIKMENTSFEIDNKSVNEHIDTAFSYYKFPARVIVEDISDGALTAQLNAVTIDTTLYYRYQADNMVLPNLDIASVGISELDIIHKPETSFIFTHRFFQFTNFGISDANIQSSAIKSQIIGPLQLNETLIKNQFYFKTTTGNQTYNNYFNLVNPTDKGPVGVVGGGYFYQQGLRLTMHRDETKRDPRLTNINPNNAIVGDAVGLFVLGQTTGTTASDLFKKTDDGFYIQEPYLKDKLLLNTSYWFTIYNSVRYTNVGRRIVELDQIAINQIRENKSQGRYVISSNDNKEFDHIKFREYDWLLYYSTSEQTTISKPSKGGIFQYRNDAGLLTIPQQTFKLNYQFDSILNENFKEISFNQIIDGSQQILNRFTVTKDIMNYNQALVFDINIGLSHMNPLNAFIIRILQYSGDTAKPYKVIKQLSHLELAKSSVKFTKNIDSTIKKNELNQELITANTNLGKAQKYLININSSLAVAKTNAENISSEPGYKSLVAIRNDEYKTYLKQKEDVRYLKELFGNFTNAKQRESIAVEEREMAAALKKYEAAIENINQYVITRTKVYREQIDYYNAEIASTTILINTIKARIDTINNDLGVLSITDRPLSRNSKIILGLESYITAGKSYFKIKHAIDKDQLNIFDSYAVEILTNSPIKTENDIDERVDSIPMELITDNTSWEIRPGTDNENLDTYSETDDIKIDPPVAVGDTFNPVLVG